MARFPTLEATLLKNGMCPKTVRGGERTEVKGSRGPPGRARPQSDDRKVAVFDE